LAFPHRRIPTTSLKEHRQKGQMMAFNPQTLTAVATLLAAFLVLAACEGVTIGPSPRMGGHGGGDGGAHSR
jgi:hypothetical protein